MRNSAMVPGCGAGLGPGVGGGDGGGGGGGGGAGGDGGGGGGGGGGAAVGDGLGCGADADVISPPPQPVSANTPSDAEARSNARRESGAQSGFVAAFSLSTFGLMGCSNFSAAEVVPRDQSCTTARSNPAALPVASYLPEATGLPRDDMRRPWNC